MSKPITDLQQWGKFLSNYNGKDKFARCIQYGSRGLRYYILESNPDSAVGAWFNTLYSTLSVNRKGMRLMRLFADYHEMWEKYTKYQGDFLRQ